MPAQTVTCSFKMDRDTYYEYRSIVVGQGHNVKGDLVRYMQKKIADHNKQNAKTLAAIEEDS